MFALFQVNETCKGQKGQYFFPCSSTAIPEDIFVKPQKSTLHEYDRSATHVPTGSLIKLIHIYGHTSSPSFSVCKEYISLDLIVWTTLSFLGASGMISSIFLEWSIVINHKVLKHLHQICTRNTKVIVISGMLFRLSWG